MIAVGLMCWMHKSYHGHRDSKCVDCHAMFQHIKRLQYDVKECGIDLVRSRNARNQGGFFYIGCPKHQNYRASKLSSSCPRCSALYNILFTLEKRVDFENGKRELYVLKHPGKTPTGRNVVSCRYGLEFYSDRRYTD
jgi:hypothetical protein